MPYYQKKPVVVEAVKITKPMEIETLEGTMKGDIGDMLITGIHGEQYPCKPYIFEKSYCKVTEKDYKSYKKEQCCSDSLGER